MSLVSRQGLSQVRQHQHCHEDKCVLIFSLSSSISLCPYLSTTIKLICLSFHLGSIRYRVVVGWTWVASANNRENVTVGYTPGAAEGALGSAQADVSLSVERLPRIRYTF